MAKKTIGYQAHCQQPGCIWSSNIGTIKEATEQAKRHLADKGHRDYIDVPLWDLFKENDQ